MSFAAQIKASEAASQQQGLNGSAPSPAPSLAFSDSIVLRELAIYPFSLLASTSATVKPEEEVDEGSADSSFTLLPELADLSALELYCSDKRQGGSTGGEWKRVSILR